MSDKLLIICKIVIISKKHDKTQAKYRIIKFCQLCVFATSKNFKSNFLMMQAPIADKCI